MMSKEKEESAPVDQSVQVGDHLIPVRTLTLGEIRAWFRALGEHPEGATIDLVDELLFERMSMREIGMLTSLPAVAAETLTPQEIAPLVEAFCAANPHWVGVRKRLSEVGRAAAKAS